VQPRVGQRERQRRGEALGEVEVEVVELVDGLLAVVLLDLGCR